MASAQFGEIADQFAVDLSPQTILGPYACNRPVTLQAVRELAEKFDTSLAATTIRLLRVQGAEMSG